MHAVFKFNRGIVTNTSKYNLAVLCHKNNVFCQNLNENKKRYLISSTRVLDLLCQLTRRLCCILIYLHMYMKK